MSGTGTPSPPKTADRSRSPGRDHADERLARILLPVGPSDRGRIQPLAATVAETGGMLQAHVHVLHVFTPERFDRIRRTLEVPSPGAPSPTEVARRVEPVRDLTAALARPLRGWGVPLTVEGRVGETVSDEIVATADAIDAKRVLIGGRRRTPTGKAVFGSTAQTVLLNAPCPVTFVRDP